MVVALVFFNDGWWPVSLMLDSWSCVLGVVLPAEVVLFVVSVILLDCSFWMKLILIVIHPCYLCLKLWVALRVLLSLVFLVQVDLLFWRFIISETGYVWFFWYSIFLLSHKLCGSLWFIFQSIELFDFSFLQYLFSSWFVVFNCSLNPFKLFLVLCYFSMKTLWCLFSL